MKQQDKQFELGSTEGASNNQPNGPSIPTITLPKGGGAVRGIGEKFTANPVTGTGSLTVPIATSPGRSGFGPQLSLAYDSGSGNGPFGLGWSLALPSITRKTDKGLPKYHTTSDHPDVFILSGVEDLVPALIEKSPDEWVPETVEPRTVDRVVYQIDRFRPRIEGLFARIERWTNRANHSDCFWRSISRDNITTWYGRTKESRINDPFDESRIFSWLICESYDDRGNVISYRYKSENSDDVATEKAHERNRNSKAPAPGANPAPDPRSANRYLKNIRYGNHAPYLPKLKTDQPWPSLPANDKWYFEVVLDYGEHDAAAPLPDQEITKWHYRPDSFSSYRAGFEVRTYRLCQRVLMFHHFEGEANVERNCLVRSTDFTYSANEVDSAQPTHSVMLSVSHSSYRRSVGGYQKRSLPPLDFTYSRPSIDETVRSVDLESLENLPSGIDGKNYQWVDLDGEGLSGILTRQGQGWFYKRNLSPLNALDTSDPQAPARFAAMELISSQPALAAMGRERQRFMDLAGDGQLDLVDFEGPTPGFYERTIDETWESFTPFSSLPVVDWNNRNLRFLDLTGDGLSDILVTEDDVFRWYPSLGEDGFGQVEQVPQAWDDERGPRLVFADSNESIYLADFTGDGLTDLVRIRNGEICYWPNLGYARFGAKVTMDNAPWFDNPDQFQQERIRLADIDGSGLIDIVYLNPAGINYYFNQSGNSWSQGRALQISAPDNLSEITVLDLLGKGTSCLLLSNPSPGAERLRLSYVDLMREGKPHLLLNIRNNLGAQTEIEYAPSTQFYLADKRAGTPWITKLPFPVHCVQKVTVRDKWRRTAFTTTYSYHHGYFDGIEREFRGFGRIEQLDVESYGEFAKGNADSPYITGDKTLYQPPIQTVTWYHTGALLERNRILRQFENEYFPNWLPANLRDLGGFREKILTEPELDAAGLTAEEWPEALRACKGMPLRQEVYELNVDELHEHHKELRVRLFSSAYHNCNIRKLQPKLENSRAVFLVTEGESITYNHELDLRADEVAPDPRITHTLNLNIDEYGNVLQSVTVVYGRRGRHVDSSLPAGTEDLIAGVQKARHLAYLETHYTASVNLERNDPDRYRLRMPCAALSYELTGISPKAPDGYFNVAELLSYKLSDKYPMSGELVTPIAYHELPNPTEPLQKERRLVEHVRILYFDDGNEVSPPTTPLPYGQLGPRGFKYEDYKLALTDELLNAVFQRRDAVGATVEDKLATIIAPGQTARALLQNAKRSGYVAGATIEPGLAGQFWIRSGIAGFAPDGAQHFFLPERYTDPFENVTTVAYDKRDLFVESATDALQNTTQVTQFDFRVMAPGEVKDQNNNFTALTFDTLGFPTGNAVMGKRATPAGPTESGDNLNNLTPDVPHEDIEQFLTNPFNVAIPRTWLGNATSRFVYDVGEKSTLDGSITYEHRPPAAVAITRETHVAQTAEGPSKLQMAVEFTDGLGTVLVKKAQAEPVNGDPTLKLQWVASGKVVLNNKGKPVKQYEPYFSNTEHRFDPDEAENETGVTPVMYYDSAGRLVRTEFPDGSYSRVDFSPWHVASYDANDTVFDPLPEKRSDWYKRRTEPAHARFAEFNNTQDRRAADLAAIHANTPAVTHLDSLGRNVISIQHNKYQDAAGTVHDEKYVSFTKLDAEGKPLWIRDARKNLVMQYIMPPVPNNQASDPQRSFVPCYDIAGNLLFHHSMDAGDRWMLNDAGGKPIVAWTSRGHAIRFDYDALHRPVASFVKGTDPLDPTRIIQFDQVIYGDTPGNGLSAAPANDQTRNLNLRGKAFTHNDTAGRTVSRGRNPVTGADEAFDFKGNLLRSTRQFLVDYKSLPDWSQNPALQTEIFTSSARYDALNRVVQMVEAHSNQAGTKLNVIRSGYNETRQLQSLDVWLEQNAEPVGLLPPSTANLNVVTNIDYNAKGQRTRIEYNETGHAIVTELTYDPETFRLTRLRSTRPAHSETDKRILQNLSYSYDAVGNITEIVDAAQQAVFFNNTLVAPSNSYAYDALYRLIRAEGREHAVQNNVQRDAKALEPSIGIPFLNSPEALQRYIEDYEYDSVGNILALHHTGGAVERWIRRYQYALDSNHLLSTRLPGDPANLPNYAATPGYTSKYTHDVHGNMTSMLHLSVMEWNFKDQLRTTQQQVVNGGTGEKTYYVYNARGQRVRKVTETQSGKPKNERLYLGGFEVFRKYNSVTQSVTLERETLNVMDSKQCVALIETRTQLVGVDPAPPFLVRYQLSNHLGSASLEVDDQAQVISYEEYHPYGTSAYEATRSQTDTPKRYRYTGKERDEETGLNYHGARYYATWLGRWTSTDPKGLVDGLNLFAYCRDAPITLVDPSGTSPISEDSVLDVIDRTLTKKGIAYNTEVTLLFTLPTGMVVARRFDRVYLDPTKGWWVAIEAKGAHPDKLTEGQEILDRFVQLHGAEFIVLSSSGKAPRGSKSQGVILTPGSFGRLKPGNLLHLHGNEKHVQTEGKPISLPVTAWRELMEKIHADAVRPQDSAMKTSEKGVEWVPHEELKKEEAKKGPTKQEKNEAERAKADERVREQMKRAESKPETKPEAKTVPSSETEGGSVVTDMMKVAAAITAFFTLLAAFGEAVGEAFAAVGAFAEAAPRVRVAAGEVADAVTQAIEKAAPALDEGAEAFEEMLEEGADILEKPLRMSTGF